MKITNHDKDFLAKMIESFEKLFPLEDSATFQFASSKFKESLLNLKSADSELYLKLDDWSSFLTDISSYYHFFLGMRTYRSIQFMIDNPVQAVDLLHGKDDTIC